MSDTLKSTVNLDRPRDFQRLAYESCNRAECANRASFRIGPIDVCRRHTTWVLDFLMDREITKAGQPLMPIGRYET